MKGRIDVKVSYKGQQEHLSALVVQGEGPCLMGRDWLNKIKIDWHEINIVQSCTNTVGKLEYLLSNFSELFQEQLGTLKNYKAKIFVDPEAKPVFIKARPLPYAMRKGVEEELERLVQEGTISPVLHSDWAAAIVPVVKADGRIRICGDYKTTVNKVSKLDSYPIPRTEDLLAHWEEEKGSYIQSWI